MEKSMKNLAISALALTLVLWFSPALTAEIKKIEWQDLIPARLLATDPLAHLSAEDREMAEWIINLRENLPAEVTPQTRELHKELAKAIPVLKKKGLDIDKVIAWRKKLDSSMVPELDGAKVSLAGYLLPLEMSGAAAKEFLLVPYIGACIHVPPPPLNQIVHVTMSGEAGYAGKEMFEPVLVTGTISSKPVTKDLFLADGSSDVSIGYAMAGDKVEPYRQ